MELAMRNPAMRYPAAQRYASAARATVAALVLLLSAPFQLAQGSAPSSGTGEFVGFDRNDYPGDSALLTLRRHFSFVGYWLNNPPGASANSWKGKRELLLRTGFGFLVLWNGRLDKEILGRKRAGTEPAALAVGDALDAIVAARAEHFPPGTILFLDQEEGGRMLPEQAAYILAWTETVARGGYSPGVYGSGQPVDEGPGPGGKRVTITTAQDIQEHVRTGHHHPIALWVAQDSCPPAPGCVLQPPPLARSGTPGALVWQYAQSPRRPEITRSCARTYRSDGNCTVPELPTTHLDLSVSRSADPSHGR
jgi:hypothetical protein